MPRVTSTNGDTTRTTDAPADALTLDGRPESLTHVVYETIREAIVSKALPPGSRVTEAGLAARLNVSKTPVREALLKLREAGLVEPDGRRGGRIVAASPAALQHAYEVREALELWATRRTAEQGDPAVRAALVDAARRSLAAARAGDYAGFQEWGDAFHDGVAAAPGNPRLTELLQRLYAVIVTLRSRDAPGADFPLRCGEAHLRIAEAIAAGDPDEAEAAMRAHLREVERVVLAGVAGDQIR